jgi:hypothetical protein
VQTHTGIKQLVHTEDNNEADLVRGADGTWLIAHITELGQESRYNTAEGTVGSMDAVPTPPPGSGPNVVPTPVPPSIAADAAQISLPTCETPHKAGAPAAYIEFVNLAQSPIKHIAFAVLLGGHLVINPSVDGTFSTGVKTGHQFNFPRAFDGKVLLVEPMCYVQSVTRADGSTWVNPDASLAPPVAAP